MMKGKKIMALLLSVIMMITMIPATVFGVEATGGETEQNQTVEAHKTAKLLEDGKTAEITMTVKGKQNTTANIGADVILVVDNSGSMNTPVPCKNKEFICHEPVRGWTYYECTDCYKKHYVKQKPDSCTGDQRRMVVAKKAAYTFVEKMLEDSSENNRVAIIPFTSVVDDSGKRSAVNFTTVKGKLDKCVKNMYASGGTSYTAALAKAQEFVEGRKVKTRPVYVIMMSDGAPGGCQDNTQYAQYNGTREAKALIKKGVTIYSVGISLSKTWEENAMKAVASKLNGNPLYQNVGNENLATDLKGVLGGIVGEIMSSGRNAIIEDWVNDTDFDISTIEIPEKYHDKLKKDSTDNKKLIWDIGTINEDELQTITFTVKLKDEKVKEGGTFYTNKDVTLSYIGSDGKEYNQGKEIIGHPQVTVVGKAIVTFRNNEPTHGVLSKVGVPTDDEGSIIIQNVPYGTAVNTLLPTTTGKTVKQVPYTFDKWTDEENKEVTFSDTVPMVVTGNVTYTAHWREKAEEKRSILVCYYKILKRGNTVPIEVDGDELVEKHEAYLGDEVVIEPSKYLNAAYFKDDLAAYNQNRTTAKKYPDKFLEKREDGTYKYTVEKADKTLNKNEIYIHVIYEMNEYSLKFKADSNGSVSGVREQTVVYGEDAEVVKAIPLENCRFVKWTKTTNDTTVDVAGANENLTVTNVTKAATYTAHFASNEYIVTFKPGLYGLLNEKKEDVIIRGIQHGATWNEAITKLPVIKPNENSGWVVNSRENWTPTLPERNTQITGPLTFTAQYNPTYIISYFTLEDYLNDKSPFDSKANNEITSGTVLNVTDIPQHEVKNIPDGYKKVFIVGIQETAITKPGTVVKVVYDKTAKDPTEIPVEKDGMAIVGVRHLFADGKKADISIWNQYQVSEGKEVVLNPLYEDPEYIGYKVAKATLTVKQEDKSKEEPIELTEIPAKINDLKAKAEYVVTYVYEKENTINITDRYDKDVQRSSMTWKKNETYTIKLQFSGRYTMVMKVTVNGKEVSLTNGNLVINQKFLKDNQIIVGEDNKLNIVFTYKKKSSGGGGGGSSSSKEKPTIIDEPKIPLSALETDEHFAYVFGYPDGTVKPENLITREEVTSIFYRLLKDEVRESFFTTKHEYLDVVMDRWSNKSIATLKNGAIITGYPDGEFKPARSITRAEFATIASRFDSLEVSEKDMFSDISGHWANKYINSAAQKGWINGYPNGTFKPDQNITRAEAMTLINNVLNRRVDKEGLLPNARYWKDNDVKRWYFTEVMEATNSHDYKRQDTTAVEKWTAIKGNKVWDEK